METIKMFADRVFNITGRHLVTMPIVGEENATRHKLCRWTAPEPRPIGSVNTILIVGMDNYPQRDEDGNPIFTKFGKVLLKKHLTTEDEKFISSVW